MSVRLPKLLVCMSLGVLFACILPSLTAFAPPFDAGSRSIDSPPPLSIPTLQEKKSVLWNPWSIKPIHISNIDSETLWLARAMFSESKRYDEQELIGWTVRNRLETNYRGCTTYKDCVLDPFQFSAFIPNQNKYRYFTNLTEMTELASWQKTIALAFHIRHAESQLRPFGYKVRHFYSEQSMLNEEIAPEWVGDLTPIVPYRNFQLNERRFRFYSDVR
ncbi:MAG: hypothetical protein OXE59_06110 [Bacteroidetes bacterium]|nr:hypothetical protein [Bacteroidota bacterium]MCY4233298.1 hypothetical protein [Bacteroidota bacterium]